MRIKQEIMLGIGGYRALRAHGIEPTVYYMNEGHLAFLALASDEQKDFCMTVLALRSLV
jgi:glucan phosphorylase